ncbi:hypothetical protein SAMN05421539_11550 [Jannaschia seohaensis]|uniref:Uncharacterized protein n=1 Tax=Jannaschia seohaensis TaxID=475081 RepID=A0A2Y9C322_9RHOB|nr:hypothetical protein BCF38_11550 [Jannaschia seohaensis]SSA50722.1 hypothetical protein SAMN05421539_11550 [Jannaschia seohaensis]
MECLGTDRTKPKSRDATEVVPPPETLLRGPGDRTPPQPSRRPQADRREYFRPEEGGAPPGEATVHPRTTRPPSSLLKYPRRRRRVRPGAPLDGTVPAVGPARWPRRRRPAGRMSGSDRTAGRAGRQSGPRQTPPGRRPSGACMSASASVRPSGALNPSPRRKPRTVRRPSRKAATQILGETPQIRKMSFAVRSGAPLSRAITVSWPRSLPLISIDSSPVARS